MVRVSLWVPCWTNYQTYQGNPCGVYPDLSSFTGSGVYLDLSSFTGSGVYPDLSSFTGSGVRMHMPKLSMWKDCMTKWRCKLQRRMKVMPSKPTRKGRKRYLNSVMILDIWGQMFSKKEGMMRILKLTKYRLKAQLEKDEGPSGEGWRLRGRDTIKTITCCWRPKLNMFFIYNFYLL